MILFRPVGTTELNLIKQSNYKEFPPRLPEHPIFYPVLNEEYACETAEKWNTKTGDGKGSVTLYLKTRLNLLLYFTKDYGTIVTAK